MPKYDFICNKCNKIVEYTIDDADITEKVCDCGGIMERQFPTSFTSINSTQSHNWWRSHPDPNVDMEKSAESLRKRGYDEGERAKRLAREFKNIEGGK